MEIEAQKHLEDVRHATEMALKFTDGRTFHDYQQDDLLRSGVERQFEIIAFRNIPVYGVTSSTRVTQCFTLEKNPVGGGGAPKEAPCENACNPGASASRSAPDTQPIMKH